MTQLEKAARQALDALRYHTDQTRPFRKTDSAMTALKKALDKAEPVSNKTRIITPQQAMDDILALLDTHFPGQQATVLLHTDPEPVIRAIEDGASFDVLEKLAADFRKGLK